MSKFTPGPWEVGETNHNPLEGVVGETAIVATGPTVTGICCPAIVMPFMGFDEMAEANAHLIAAAPDLFEAAKLFVEEYDACDDHSGVGMMLAYNRALDAAKSALAKARGEAE